MMLFVKEAFLEITEVFKNGIDHLFQCFTMFPPVDVKSHRPLETVEQIHMKHSEIGLI